MNQGLVMVQLGNPTKEELAAKQAEEDQKERTVKDSLGSKLSVMFTSYRESRRTKEQEWIEDLQAYNGIYTAEEKAKRTLNDVYVGLTRTKTQAAYSRIIDLLFQAADDHWDIGPTPMPEVSEKMKNSLKLRVMATLGEEPSDKELEFMINDLAEVTAERMKRKMKDQLEDTHYDTHLKTAILEQCILGTGAIKGITTRRNKRQGWAMIQGSWVMDTVEAPTPSLGAVSIFDLFQDPYASSQADMTGIFERHVMTHQKFGDLRNFHGFDKDIINEILTESPEGNYVPEDYETQLRNIAGSLEQAKPRRFVVLEYWGLLTGTDLIAAGLADVEAASEHQANVWVCNGRTLMARLTPIQPETIPYHLFPYEKVPHQFWGIGPPRMMRDSQYTINSGVNTILANLAISSGPQVEVNKDLLADGESATDVKPWRVWVREGGDAAHPMVRFTMPQNITSGLNNIVDMARKFADEETSIPSYTHGETSPGLNKTASGMSMLMGAANTSLKATIKNIDDYCIRPLMTNLYNWNMRWGDESIKGDLNVSARGSTVLVAKEIRQQRLMQFLQLTGNPLDAPLTERLYLLREGAESLEIDSTKAIKTDEEIEAIIGVGGPGGAPAGPANAGGMGDPNGVPVQA